MLVHKIRKYILPMIMLLCVTGAVQAGTAGWSDYGQVVELQATTHGRFLVRLALPKNPSGCPDKEWFYRDYGGPGPEYMYQTLLTAVTAGKAVRVYVTGVCDLYGYAEITSLQIAP